MRLLYDASNGVRVNHRIRVRDRQRVPSADDAEAVLRCLEDEHAGGKRISLVVD